ncbi:cyanuric acid amidohydrolase [Natronincola ferrireducens]|uniref:Cyclic amide hydrolase n=1 Tax=Natronincola ferrireducens TaxID=393762 RepID=A0A1G9G157_9FIRM|nr:ring-opening amidohydrolase [Natronincola ferrireducens]SDK94376.1 cyanuric acid amidohydrolase [Natronincola ferrireducens]
MMDVGVYRLPMAGPSDVSELEALINKGEVNPEEICAIIAQTEGDGYARGFGALSFEVMLSEKMNISREEVANRIPMLMIGLTGGLMSPHYTVFTRKNVEVQESDEKRLALGIKITRVLLPEEYGTVVQVKEVAKAVKEAMEEAGITSIDDIHCVEVKCPNLTADRVADAESRGKKVVTTNFAEAGAKSKGASALGVALALGEIKEEDLTDDVICKDWSLYSKVASTSAGNEQVACKVIVMGNSTKSVSPYKIGSGVMKDTLDVEGAKTAFKGAGLKFDDVIPQEERDKIATVFINAGADAQGSIRGRRTTMKSDFLAGYAGIFAKAVINAIVGSLIGDTMILASAGFEHQGPLGANLVAAIAKVEER